MKATFLGKILLAFGLALSAGLSFADGPRTVSSSDGRLEATAVLTPESPTLADTPTLDICVAHDPAFSIAPPSFDADYGSFRVLGMETPPPVIENGRETTLYRLRLAPTEPGETALLPISITARPTDGGEETSLLIPAGKVTIASAFEQGNVSLDRLTAAQKPIPRPWALFAAAAGIILAAALFAVWRVSRRRKKERERIAAIRTPSEIALEALEKLIASKLHLRDVRAFYLSLTGIVRRFIEETTGVRAPEQTTEEFLTEMESNRAPFFDDATRRDLAGFLEFSDLVKFAKFRPTVDEIDDGCRKARKVVDR